MVAEDLVIRNPDGNVWYNDKYALKQRSVKDKKEQIDLIPEKAMSGIWHDGKEVPHTGRIMFESTDGGLRFADYDREIDRFDSYDECYYSGNWGRCHIKRWIYEQELLML